jgi:UDP-2-acetamido-3-amino-2,3-dideoxy-glucuronate N-acetyltransferase
MKNEKIFVHESSYIDDSAVIGDGTKIWHFSHIQDRASIGKNCVIGQNVNIGPGVVIGDNVKIQNNVSVYKGVTIEDDVFIGPSVVFTNVSNPRSFVNRKDEFKETLVKRGCSIGANATILCGVEIGYYSLIGAGSLVVKDVLDYSLSYGSPSERKDWICECGEKLSKLIKRKWYCKVCDKRYKYDWHKLDRLE